MIVIDLKGAVVAVANPELRASAVIRVTIVRGVPDIEVMNVMDSVMGFFKLGVIVTAVTTVRIVPDSDVVNVILVVVGSLIGTGGGVVVTTVTTVCSVPDIEVVRVT